MSNKQRTQEKGLKKKEQKVNNLTETALSELRKFSHVRKVELDAYMKVPNIDRSSRVWVIDDYSFLHAFFSQESNENVQKELTLEIQKMATGECVGFCVVLTGKLKLCNLSGRGGQTLLWRKRKLLPRHGQSAKKLQGVFLQMFSFLNRRHNTRTQIQGVRESLKNVIASVMQSGNESELCRPVICDVYDVSTLTKCHL